MNQKIGILGAGAWGITLAALLSENNNDVTLWEFDSYKANQLFSKKTLDYFPHIKLSGKVFITNDLKEACQNKDILLFAVPSHTLRHTCKKIVELNLNFKNTVAVSAVKGLELETLKRMSEIILEELPDFKNRFAVLTGPTIAKEVAEKIPTIVTVASDTESIAKYIQDIFRTAYFRTYTSSDVTGTELGGALKNVFAIAAGIIDGLKFGCNTKSALVSRGLKEITKLAVKMGAQQPTLFGLTGLGDMVVTSFSKSSRNRQLGQKLAEGKTIEEAEKDLIMVAEGVKTAKSAYELSIKYKIELPIIHQVYEIIYNKKSPKVAVNDLMSREIKPEWD